MYKQLMKKTIFSLLLLAVCSLGASAQSADELDAKYTQGLLKVGTQAPDFVLKKAKADQPALFCLLTAPIRKAHCCVLAVG